MVLREERLLPPGVREGVRERVTYVMGLEGLIRSFKEKTEEAHVTHRDQSEQKPEWVTCLRPGEELLRGASAHIMEKTEPKGQARVGPYST